MLFALEEAAETPEEPEPAEEPAVPEETEPSEEPVAPEEDSPTESADDFADGSVEAADTDTIDAEAAELVDPENAEPPAENDTEEVPSEEPEEAETPDEDVETEGKIESEEPETETIEEPEAEDEPTYETLRISDAKAEVVARERKEPETDRERDMLLRYPEELTSELTYKDPETGLNVHYILSGKRLSEQIILDHAPETAIAYSALLTVIGLKAEEKNGRIVLVNDSGEAIFEILVPVMYDANGEESAEIEVRLIETEEGYAYTLIPDEAWLKDESRAYPVVIDPDIQGGFATNVVDTYAAFISPDTNYSSSDRLSVSPYDYSLIRIRE